MSKGPGYHLEQAKAEEIAADYAQRGYKVRREVAEGDARFDLIAEKPGQKIYIELIYRPDAPAKAARMSLLKKIAKEHGATDFKVVLFDTPKEIEIEIDGLEEALLEALDQDGAQGQLVSIGNGVSVEGIYLGRISFLHIGDAGIRIRGSAEIDVEVMIGPSHEGDSLSENFPVEYDITLDVDRKLDEVHEISIDSSSFFGRDEEDDEDDERASGDGADSGSTDNSEL